jgi:UDP-glucose 4-epimerase
MAVAVIGGAGFIGSNIVDELLVNGFEVTVLDNFLDGKLENLARWKGNDRLEVIRGDATDFELVKRVLDHKAWVFHLAAMARIQPSITDPHFALRNNIMSTVNVLEAARLTGVKRVVYSASSSVTGDKGANLASHGRPTSEAVEPDLKSPYALSKYVGEELIDLYWKLYGLSTVSLRYFNVYGPRHQEMGSYATVIAIFRKQARLGQPLTVVGDGTQRRDFTFVGDVTRANMMAAMNQDVHGTLNIGTGKNYSMLEIAELVAPGHPIEFVPVRKGEYAATLADTTRAKNELGWKAEIDFPTGLHVLDKYEQMNTHSKLIVLR